MTNYLPWVVLFVIAGVVLAVWYPVYTTPMNYALLAVAVGLVVLFSRKGRITTFDWLVMYLALIPFHSFRVGTESFFLRPTELAFIPLGFFWLLQRRVVPDRQTQKIPEEYIILFFFVVFSFLSVYKSVQPLVSIHRTLVLTYLIVLSFMVSTMARTGEKLLRIVKILVGVAALAGLMAILQTFFHKLYPFYPRPFTTVGSVRLIRAGAGWLDPSYFALFLTVLIPISISMIRSGLATDRRWFRNCLLLQVGGLLASASRAGVLSLFAGYIFLLWADRREKIAVTMIIVLIFLLAVAAIGMEYIYTNYPYLRDFMFRIPSLAKLQQSPQLILGYRWDSWRANFAMFLDNPVLGVGPFMAGEHYKEYRPADQLFPLEAGLNPHSEYMSLLSERGMLGFLTFAFFLMVLFNRAKTVIRDHGDRMAGVLMRGFAAGVVGFLVFSVGGTSIYSVEFWIIVGLMTGLGETMRAVGTERVPSPPA